jgi:hypothetical protein
MEINISNTLIKHNGVETLKITLCYLFQVYGLLGVLPGKDDATGLCLYVVGIAETVNE